MNLLLSVLLRSPWLHLQSFTLLGGLSVRKNKIWGMNLAKIIALLVLLG